MYLYMAIIISIYYPRSLQKRQQLHLQIVLKT